MKIQVTQEDIDLAKTINFYNFPKSENCPVSQALKRYFPKGRVASCKEYIIIPLGTFQAPSNVYSFIKDFDEYMEVKPFEFELTVSNKVS